MRELDSNDIKLVEFGLARYLTTEDDVKSSFGTLDFVGKKEFIEHASLLTI